MDEERWIDTFNEQTEYSCYVLETISRLVYTSDQSHTLLHYKPVVTSYLVVNDSCLHGSSRDGTLLCRGILRHTRMGRNLSLVMLKLSVRHWAHSARVLLVQSRMRGREVCVDRADDRTSGIGEGLLGVGVLKRWASRCVHGGLVIGGHGRV